MARIVTVIGWIAAVSAATFPTACAGGDATSCNSDFDCRFGQTCSFGICADDVGGGEGERAGTIGEGEGEGGGGEGEGEGIVGEGEGEGIVGEGEGEGAVGEGEGEGSGFCDVVDDAFDASPANDNQVFIFATDP